MSDSATPQTAAHQASPFLGFSRQDTGVGCHFLLQCMKVKSESEVAQSCPTLRNPMDCKPTRLLCPWDSSGKNTGVGCHFLLQCMKVKSESEVVQSCPTLRDLPSMGFFRQEYWSGVPLPSTSCEILGWMKHKLKSRLPGEIITLEMQMTPPLQQKGRRTKEPRDESERVE